ncbi:MAG: ABC transporter permease [Thermoanaerobaculia bacterium]
MSAATTSNRSLPRIYWLEARYELLKVLRLPAFAIPSIAFPLLFYVFFGLSFGGGRAAGSVSMATYLLATYGAFGVIGAALFGFGVGVAIERGQGWMSLKRASPMPPLAYFTAKIFMAVIFGIVIIGSLYGLGIAFGGVAMTAERWLRLALVHVTGALPFCAMGLALGYWAGPNSAPAIVNLIYLPMAFASGLWVPLPALPGFFRALAPWLPAYHYAQLALDVIGAGAGQPASRHVLYLVCFTVLCLVVARFGYLRDEDRTWG